jgi:parallel beta-helix repeat protein
MTKKRSINIKKNDTISLYTIFLVILLAAPIHALLLIPQVNATFPVYSISQSDNVINVTSLLSGTIVYSGSNANSAFTTAFGYVASGGKITVEPGTYTASTTIMVKHCANVTLVFESGAVLTIGNDLNSDVLDLWYDTNCSLLNLNINGNGQNQAGGSSATSRGLEMYDCSNCVAIGAKITDCSKNGFGTSDDTTTDLPNGIVNSAITFCGWNGITLAAGGTAYAINNTVAYCSDVGITNYGVGDTVIGNFVYDMNGTTNTRAHWGIAVEGGGWDLIENNTLLNDKTGICLAPDTGQTVQSNLVISNNLINCGTGIADSSVGYNTIIQNQITNWGSIASGYYDYGLGIVGCVNDILASNTLTNTNTTSVAFVIYTATSVNESICNNLITTQTASGQTGILALTGANSTLIEGNKIQATTGISIDGSTCNNNRVYQNNFFNCKAQISNTGTNTITDKPKTSLLTINCLSLNGAVTPSAGTYLESSSNQVTITLTPNTNCAGTLNVDSLNVTLTDDEYILPMTQDHYTYVLFSSPSLFFSPALPTFTITASSDKHSSISPSGSVQVGYGKSQSFTYSANTGYTVTSVLVDDRNVSVTGIYTFSNVKADHTIAVSATPAAIPTLAPAGTPTLAPAATPTFTPATTPIPSVTQAKIPYLLLLIIAITVIILGTAFFVLLIKKRN